LVIVLGALFIRRDPADALPPSGPAAAIKGQVFWARIFSPGGPAHAAILAHQRGVLCDLFLINVIVVIVIHGIDLQIRRLAPPAFSSPRGEHRPDHYGAVADRIETGPPDDLLCMS
jgi:hypothetical protein